MVITNARIAATQCVPIRQTAGVPGDRSARPDERDPGDALPTTGSAESTRRERQIAVPHRDASHRSPAFTLHIARAFNAN
ncbi:MAG: hypothetical protein Q8N44_19690 [Rubrivivax sp.]|nr:hypothetical protein [Rubrivivax sp.]MDP3085896.1 hypothetical protein [Rubrivivax sp.]